MTTGKVYWKMQGKTKWWFLILLSWLGCQYMNWYMLLEISGCEETWLSAPVSTWWWWFSILLFQEVDLLFVYSTLLNKRGFFTLQWLGLLDWLNLKWLPGNFLGQPNNAHITHGWRDECQHHLAKHMKMMHCLMPNLFLSLQLIYIIIIDGIIIVTTIHRFHHCQMIKMMSVTHMLSVLGSWCLSQVQTWSCLRHTMLRDQSQTIVVFPCTVPRVLELTEH